MPSFNELFETLSDRADSMPAGSNTARLLALGTHEIGKKILEEAGEVWLAAEHESNDQLAGEIAQLIYHLQVLMVQKGISIEDIEKEL